MTSWFERFENGLLDIFTRLGPWLVPIAPAFFVGYAAEVHLSAPRLVAVTIAISVECVNIASAHLAIRLFSWNREYPEQTGPFRLALILVGACLLTSITLAVLLESFPALKAMALVLLFVLAGVSYTVLALSRDQARREVVVNQNEQEAVQLDRFYAAVRGMGVKKSEATAMLLVTEGDILTALARLEQQYRPATEWQFATTSKTSVETEEKPANGLPDWLPQIPRDRTHFRQMVQRGEVRIPDNLTGAALGEIVGKSARTGYYWLDDVKTLNGHTRQKTV